MALGRPTLPTPVRFSSRVVEWGLLVLVLLVVALMFLRQVRLVQGQAEVAAVKTTLAALRTAMVVDHIRAQVAGAQGAVAATQRNPFFLLQSPPLNYLGEMAQEAAASAAAGSWVYAIDCACVGYLPIDAQQLFSPDGTSVVWYRVGKGPGPRQLDATQAYTLQGQRLE